MKKVSMLLSVFVLLTAMLVFALQGVAVAAGWQDFWDDVRFRGDAWVNDNLTVDGDLALAGDTTVAGDLALAGDTTVTGDVSVGDDLTVADDFILTEATALTVTNGTMFTPTAGNLPIQAAGAVTPTLGACTPNGQILILSNDSNTTITFVVTGNFLGASTWAGTQYATLTLLCDGSKWREVARGMN